MSWNPGNWWRAERDYRAGFRLLSARRAGEAVKAFDRVVAARPRHSRAHLRRALALAAAGRTADAVHSARRAAELAPGSHAPLLFLGQIQFDAGRHEEARKSFAAAAKLDPGNRLVQAYLGLALLALGRIQQAADLLRAHLLYANCGLEGRLLTVGEQYLWEHEEEARSLSDQLSPEEGGRDDRPAGLGLRLASALRKVILLPLALLRGRKARCCLRAEEAMSVNDLQEAITSLREAGAAGADPEWVAVSLGSVYLQLKQPQAAAEQLVRLPSDAQRDPGLAALIGEALFESGRYAEAREPLAAAARHFTREFAPSYLRGLCEIAGGQPRAATDWFTQACQRLNPHIARRRLEEMLRVAGLAQ